jgi:hypothetical protein
LCVTNQGYPASLEVRKLYEYLKAFPSDPKSRIRVIDESGEDYLYPRAFFRRVTLPRPIKQVLVRTHTAA